MNWEEESAGKGPEILSAQDSDERRYDGQERHQREQSGQLHLEMGQRWRFSV